MAGQGLIISEVWVGGNLVTPSHPGKSPSYKAVTGIFLHLILTVDVELCFIFC